MLVDAVNQKVIEEAVAEGQGMVIDAGNPDLPLIPPDVVAAPTRSELHNLAPSAPRVVSFFGPAVVALILQHLAVTLVALSLVRERTSGVMELFRIAPVSAAEVLAGKVIAFGVLGAIIAFLTVGLLVVGFGISILGPPAIVALTIGLLLLASIGLGLVIAMVSDSERQAVQLSLLVLLAAVFFSGFVLGIDEFTAPVRALAYLLPVTHGIALLQDLMLRGSTSAIWEFGALALISVVTLFIAWVLMRRSMRTA
jgi:ABC-2 type transport system permease protein